MKKNLAILLAATVGAWSSAASADPPSSAPAQDGSPLRTAGWYTAGAGAIVLGTSAFFFVMAKNDHDEVKESRGGLADDSFDRHFTTAKVLALAGVVGVVTGVTLILVAPKHHEVALSAGPGQLTLSGSF